MFSTTPLKGRKVMAKASPATHRHLSDPAMSPPGLSGPLLEPVPANAGRNPAQRWTTVLDGQKLRQLRRQHGLSQEKLADQAGISLTTVARLERQVRPPCRCRTLARLAAALGEQPATIVYLE
jgi:DNA-binding XRE family transcriptional regulator